jgi:hypothetical protein
MNNGMKFIRKTQQFAAPRAELQADFTDMHDHDMIMQLANNIVCIAAIPAGEQVVICNKS